ncbi:hypothetical protein [Vibrio cionasavignyae]|uniref:hypothetical protein n=1 Tax=Vibrio cionasavignyae TaxID=2910252 RepID=UPI003D117E48
MLAAWKWIKWGGLALFIGLLVLQGFALKASYAKQDLLQIKLDKAEQDNQTNQRTINTLKQDNQHINQVLVARKKRQITQRQELEDEVQQLKQQMEGIKCVIPSAVTDRLREHY